MLISRLIATVFCVVLVSINAFASMTVAPVREDTPRYRWKTRTIKLAVSTSLTQPSSNIKFDNDVMAAVRRSLETWQNATGIEFQLVVSDKQSVSPSGPAGDRVSLITIAQTNENVLLFSKNPLSESARTRVFYNRAGNITEADIVLNPFQQFSTDGTFGTFDLESTLTHELGHVLGLRHSGVLGATMSDSLPRNGIFGLSDFGARTLGESDLASIRDLYGPKGDEAACCASLNGRLSGPAVKAGKSLRVWLEDLETGRVAAETEAAVDGTYKIGGVPAGIYTLFSKRHDDISSVESLGKVELKNGEAATVVQKIGLTATGPGLKYIGINSQLSDTSLPVTPGREYVVYLGGSNLTAGNLRLGFISPFFHVSQGSIANRDFGDGVSVVTFMMTVDKEALPGSYSIFAAEIDGGMGALTGGFTIE